jgi:hypothetical protein
MPKTSRKYVVRKICLRRQASIMRPYPHSVRCAQSIRANATTPGPRNQRDAVLETFAAKRRQFIRLLPPII